jgi:mannose-6-phosphate isomerase-like protein (cupin superfamily)
VKHVVGHLDWSFAETPPAPSATSGGLVRKRFIGWPEGAVHTDLSAIVLHPDGWLAPHVHSYEEALYILEGDALFLIGERVVRVTSGDYTLMPTGMRHGLANTGSVPVRFLSLNSPQKQDPDSGRTDTYFEAPQDVVAWEAIAERPVFGDPTVRYVGHYEGTGPQLEALAVRDPARGREPAGADTAILAYSGISVKMLVDRTFGADHTTMFTVDYEVGGSAQQHDHPFEEAYVFLAGEVEGELDGEVYTFRPGDWAFAPVGSVHGFYNTGTERVRWLETQAPQPPARNSYRWVASWEKYAKRLAAGRPDDPGRR